jgi:polysaccharide export outer membrane protein
MSKTIVRSLASAVMTLSALGLAGCATFSSSGPSASAVAKQAARLETVTPESATAMWQRQQDLEHGRIQDALARLGQVLVPVDVRLYPGAKLGVALWVQPIADGSTIGVGTVAKNDLGSFTVANDGTLSLPYVGIVPVSGQALEDAQRGLSARFAATRKFQAPQVTLTLEDNARQQIVVSGAVNHPTTVAWREGGVTLADALAQAGGAVVYEQDQVQGEGLTANRVSIVRKGIPYELPMRAALEADVPLRPNDQIVLEHRPAVRVQCLGGGWGQSSIQSFDDEPALSKVVASGGGLNAQTAQGASVFVLSADRTTIYQFRWDTLAGLQAAQRFPVDDGDIVYIASAPIVRLQQVTNVLFSAAYPVATAKGL